MPLLYDLSYLDSAMNFPGVSADPFEFRCALSALDLLLSQSMYFSIGEALHIPLTKLEQYSYSYSLALPDCKLRYLRNVFLVACDGGLSDCGHQ